MFLTHWWPPEVEGNIALYDITTWAEDVLACMYQLYINLLAMMKKKKKTTEQTMDPGRLHFLQKLQSHTQQMQHSLNWEWPLLLPPSHQMLQEKKGSC